MKGLPEERAIAFAEYIIQNKATVRATAAAFGISKSTVHKDVSTRLRRQSPALFTQVRAVLTQNKAERHLRGGAATKAKYKKFPLPAHQGNYNTNNDTNEPISHNADFNTKHCANDNAK